MSEDASVCFDESCVAGHAHVERHIARRIAIRIKKFEGEIVRRLCNQGIRPLPDHGVAVGKLVAWAGLRGIASVFERDGGAFGVVAGEGATRRCNGSLMEETTVSGNPVAWTMSA